MEEGRTAKQPLELDWNKLFYEGDDDGQPPSVVIVNSKALAGENWKEPVMAAADSADRRPADKHETYEQMADYVLLERINSTRQSIPNLIRTLPDKGAKLRESLKCMEEERDRRKLRRVETIHLEEGDGFEKPTQSISSSIVGGSKDFRRENMASQDQRQSSFGTSFCKKIDGNTDCGAAQAFGKEMSMLSPCMHQKMKNGKEVSQKRRHRDPSLRRSPSKHQRNKHKSNGNEKDRASSIYCQDIREKFSNFYLKIEEIRLSQFLHVRFSYARRVVNQWTTCFCIVPFLIASGVYIVEGVGTLLGHSQELVRSCVSSFWYGHNKRREYSSKEFCDLLFSDLVRDWPSFFIDF